LVIITFHSLHTYIRVCQAPMLRYVRARHCLRGVMRQRRCRRQAPPLRRALHTPQRGHIATRYTSIGVTVAMVATLLQLPIPIRDERRAINIFLCFEIIETNSLSFRHLASLHIRISIITLFSLYILYYFSSILYFLIFLHTNIHHHFNNIALLILFSSLNSLHSIIVIFLQSLIHISLLLHFHYIFIIY